MDKKIASIELRGVVYDVVKMEHKTGCYGYCDYYAHCTGACVIRQNVTREYGCVLKIR